MKMLAVMLLAVTMMLTAPLAFGTEEKVTKAVDEANKTITNATSGVAEATKTAGEVAKTVEKAGATGAEAVKKTGEAAKTATEAAKGTPGFEAVFAVAGLLAVAFIALGRRD